MLTPVADDIMPRMWRTLAALTACVIAGCGGTVVHSFSGGDSGAGLGGGDPIEGDPLDGGADSGLGSAALTVGGLAEVTASELNLRDGAGTAAAILGSMPCGTSVTLVAGPSTAPAGWWNVRWDAPGGTLIGWASGTYLVAAAAFSPSMCGSTGAGGDGGAPAGSAGDLFDRAKLAVGYSYYWGHGSWRDDGASLGSCSGSCPSCTHSGSYGADCSGFVAKVWQVPSASPLALDAHPFSTENFYAEQVYWTQIPRTSLQPADALVRRADGSGHIALYESGADPFGAVWLYEARGCATGVVHDLRTVDSSYIAIRRN
jgi:cell wall-associated NlpC family hydrolase